MRVVFTLVILFASLSGMKAQNDIEVVEKKEGENVMLVAINHTDDDIDLTLNLTVKGFVLDEKSPINKQVKAKSELVLVKMTVTPGVECEYQTSISYKRVRKVGDTSSKGKVNRTTGIQINTTKINVFTQDGCARCEFLISELEKEKMVFLELNTTIAPTNQDLMFTKLQESGFKGTSVQMPVVVYNDKVHYNIKDLKSFLKELK